MAATRAAEKADADGDPEEPEAKPRVRPIQYPKVRGEAPAELQQRTMQSVRVLAQRPGRPTRS